MKLPCIDCITLAICRSIYLKPSSENDYLNIENQRDRKYMVYRHSKSVALDRMVGKCVLLGQYLYANEECGNKLILSYEEYMRRRKTFYQYMESDNP